MADFVEIFNVDATIAMISSDIVEFSERADSVVQYVGQQAEGIAYDLAAVDTGLMRASIAYTPEYLTSSVHDYVFYSVFVNWGTRFQREQPFMSPAYDQESKDFLQLAQTL